MKYQLIFILLSVVVFGCKNNIDKADAFGNFEADPVIVSSETAGKIEQLNVEKGQKISDGFVAAIIDTTAIGLKLLQLDAQKDAVIAKRQTIQSQVSIFEEQKNTLLRNRDRIEKMLKDGASTQKQLDDISGQLNVIDKQIASTKTQFISINKEIEVLKAQKAILLDQLQRCLVKAPATGTVLETYAEQGELTAPGKPLFKMANLDELTLKVYVSGAQLPKVKLGQPVNVIVDKTATENQTFTGKVSWISSEAEFTPKIIQTKKERVKLVYAVKVIVKNNGILKIGMPGEISFQSQLQ
ncbi:MAG: HlyD family efflux transporter periplasmic adaptor subunit [Prolixibacteraceae bacterium]|nr:HlyD family efflux transporter periplasmic adaptor subunit [Prolixibacteraceae bacterium]